MNAILLLIGWVALAATLIAPFAYLMAEIDLSSSQWMMLVGTVLWFVASGLRLLASRTLPTD